MNSYYRKKASNLMCENQIKTIEFCDKKVRRCEDCIYSYTHINPATLGPYLDCHTRMKLIKGLK